VKKQFAGHAGGGAAPSAPAPKPEAPKPEAPKPEAPKPEAPKGAPAAKTQATAAPSASPAKPQAAPSGGNFQFDIVVIGGGPAGYAAAIRAGQLKKRVLCVEKENLGGTCLNWGCIPTKALLEDGAFVRRMKTEAAMRGVSFDNMQVDFSKMIARSRGIAEKLSKGIAHLFKKYEVKSEVGTGQILGPHKVKITGKDGTKEVTARDIIIATGARATQLPGMAFDGEKVITSREAMTLKQQPKRLAIIGAGAIGAEFADFYNAVGTEVTIIEMMDHLLPIEDEDVSIALERSFTKRGIKVMTKTKTEKLEKSGNGVKLTLSGGATVDADVVLVAVGVTGNLEGLIGPACKLETFKNRVKVNQNYQTTLEGVWAIGDVISMDGQRHADLAHVAHHEAVYLVERICGVSDHKIDYHYIPGCTYTHPQVASMGTSEKKLREQKRDIKVGKFPFSVSGRALAAGESEGFVKLIFDNQTGELLGVHMIGENVTELLAELVLARKLEATEAEIIEAMHPHPTMSEAVMEAAGVADGRAIHL
jgi:dihydrolipoamide dehydrogenase